MARRAAFDAVVGLVDLSRFRPEADQRWNEVVVPGLAAAVAAAGVVAAVVTTHTTDPPDWAVALATEFDVALLRGAGTAAAALANVARWRPRRAEARRWGPPVDLSDLIGDPGPPVDLGPDRGSRAAAGARVERDFRALRSAVRPRRRAGGPGAAARAARELGLSGVIAGVTSAAAAGRAATRLGGRVLVTEQIEGGDELYCGMTRARQYGPILVVGRGGAAVEREPRAAAIVGPVDLPGPGALVAEAGLEDRDASVVLVLVALGRLAEEHPRVDEIDVNPLIMTETGGAAADGLAAETTPYPIPH